MLIASLHNERIRRIINLRSRKWRDQVRLHFIEGVHLVAEALDAGADVESIVVCPELADKRFAARVPRLANLRITKVSPAVFKGLAQFNYSQGVGAVIRQRWESLEDVTPTNELCWIAVNRLQCPNNLGTLIRLSDSVGGAGIVLVEDSANPAHPSVDPYHPASVRASLGAIFSQRLSRATLAEFAAWKRRHGCQVVGTSPDASTDYRSATYRPPLVLFMGNEWTGLSPEHLELCDLSVRIPMSGRVPSHSVPTAAAVVAYEILAQCRA